MGEVFLAFDRRLERRVAIKCLRSGLDATGARERLRREARAAARLHHSSIVQVFDLIEAADRDWIVMELVDGPRLADLTARGPLPLPQILLYGRQVAEGLAAAHAQGFVHRDLKAENVLIARGSQETAKILDFGLVRNVETDSTEALTRAGMVLGTIRTMAPEQVRGLAVGPRADLFSLGVLLYEMASGRSPFHGASTAEILHRIVAEPPAPLPPEVPGELAALIGHLLQKAPELRPASAAAVAQRLAALSAETSGPLAGTEAATEHTALPPVAVREAAHESWTFWPRQRPKRLTTGAALLAVIAIAVVLVRPLPDSLGGRAPAPRPDAAQPYPAASRPLSAAEAKALEKEAWTALDRYDLPGRLDRAVALFQRLVENDLGSASAHAGLARAYWREWDERSGDAMWLDQALAVARHAVALDGNLPVARVSLGLVLLKAGQPDAARTELEKALALNPQNADAYRGLGELHQALNQPAEAEADFRRAIALRPTDRTFHDLLGTFYFQAGRMKEAEAEYRKSIALAPDGVWGLRNLAGVLISGGRLPEAAALLQRAIQVRPSSTLYSNLGTVYFYQGLYPEAAAAYKRALDFPEGARYHGMWGNLGDAWRQIPHHRNEAPDAFRQASRLLSPEVERDPGNARLRSQLALYLAKAGEGDAARREIARTTTTEGRSLYRLAIACEVLGDRERALGDLQQAFQQGFPPGEAAREPDLLELRGDTRYQRLVSTLTPRHP
jgi:serine/threonine-protein kinase